VHFKPRVDKRRFVLKLQEHMGGLRREEPEDGETSSSDSAPAMKILRIKAFLCLSDEGTAPEQHYEFDAMGTRTRWTPKSGSLDKPFNPTLSPGFSLVLFMGLNLRAEALQELLMDTRAPLREFLELKTRESLTAEEIAAVNKEKQCEPCPPGMYYTGTHWVNFYGEPIFEHPCLEEFLEEYIELANKDAVAHNAVVTEEHAFASQQAAMTWVQGDGITGTAPVMAAPEVVVPSTTETSAKEPELAPTVAEAQAEAENITAVSAASETSVA